MLKYTIRRLLMLIPVLLGVTFITFAIAQLTPGDPARMVLGPQASLEAIEEFREAHNLNAPLWVQYGDFLWKALHGDLGISYRSRTPVIEDILERFPSTLELTLAAMVLSIMLGVPAGIIAATSHNKFINSIIMVFALIGLSLPSFWLAILLLIVFGTKLHWVSVLGGTGLKNLILPAFVLAFGSAGVLARLTRSSILEVLQDDYVRTARAKGLRDRIVTMKHVLPNALIPVVTVLGMQFAILLGGAVFVENVFARPGLGRFAVQSIAVRDYPQVMGMVVFTAVIYALINLLVDLIYGFLDPRIRYD